MPFITALPLIFILALAGGCSSAGSGGNGNATGPSATIPDHVSLDDGWLLTVDPVHTGIYGIASDPVVLRIGDRFRMYYTGLDPFRGRTVICAAVSDDGYSWTSEETGHAIPGLVLEGSDGAWDENLEGCYAVVRDGTVYLYYSGYQDVGDPAKGFPAALGLATSSDGLTFNRIGAEPILEPLANGFDTHAIYSPVVVADAGGWTMVYCGHAYSGPHTGVRLLGATSPDGITWTRHPTPVLEGGPERSWMSWGAAEPALIAVDGTWWLLFTGLNDQERVIGLAYSSSPFGPWTVRADPVFTPTRGTFANKQLLAPHAIPEEDRLRVWLIGTNEDSETISIGYGQGPWPLIFGPNYSATLELTPASRP